MHDLKLKPYVRVKEPRAKDLVCQMALRRIAHALHALPRTTCSWMGSPRIGRNGVLLEAGVVEQRVPVLEA